MRRSGLLITAVTLLWATTSLAGGFLIYEHGSSATGMADARTAVANDVNALYYNPAAITELEGFQFQIGVTGILPFVSYTAAGTTDRSYIGVGGQQKPVLEDGTNSVDAKVKGFNPIHLYATYNIESIGLTVGYSLNNPFGLGTYWPGDWDGRFIGTETEIHTFFNQPTVALDIAKLAGFKDSFKLSIAAGYNFVYATAHLAKRIDLRVAEPIFGVENPEGEMRMDGTALGHGWNAALYAEVPGLLAFGASIRSGVSLPFSGKADFWYFGPEGQAAREGLASLGNVLPDESDGDITIDLPMNMNFGVAFLGVENLIIAADFYIAFFQSYDELDLQFGCVDEGTCSALEGQEPIVKDWHEAMQVSLGGEYSFVLSEDGILRKLAVRLGYGMVLSPVPDEHYDPSLPDGRRDLICGGLGFYGSWWTVDLGYMLAMWENTKDNHVGCGDGCETDPPAEVVQGNPEGFANGKYETMAHLLGLSFSGKF